MTRLTRTMAAAAGLALCTLPLCATADAATRTKAQIEHDELTAVATSHPNKAQVEHRERAELAARQAARRPSQPSGGTASGDAATWQLALSAAFGAAATGGVVFVSRRVGQRRQAVA